MKFKGQVTLEFVDIKTGEKRIEERENFIFLNKYNDLFQGDTTLQRVVIVERGSTVFPIYNRYKDYYRNYNTLLSGHAPPGTQLKKFFPKTTTSPAYWEFFSVFLPPANTQAISCISLTSNFGGDNYNTTSYNEYLKTAINLLPPCYQSPTEYLNVYYRLILLEETEDSFNNDWIKEQFILDANRSGKLFFNNDNILLYPFRIEQDLGPNGFVNFLSSGYTSLPSKQTVHPSGLNYSLSYARKIYNYPDNPPNQYNQVIDTFHNTVLRGGRSRIDYKHSFIHPEKFTPEIGGPEGFTGVGNVFGTSQPSRSLIFDSAYFPIGSGRMYASGIWREKDANNEPKKQAFPSTFQVEITQTGQLATDMKYRVREIHRTPGCELILFPKVVRHYNESFPTSSEADYYDFNAKNIMYSKPDHVHYRFYGGIRKYVEDRSFITFDSTGITIYDIYHGKLESFDSYSDPQLLAEDIRDVKVDTNGNIWIGCANTGLYKLTIDEKANTKTLTKINAPDGCYSRVYALDVDNFGGVHVIWWGQGYHYSIDEGQSWTNVYIDYPSFSGTDENGTYSKWRFCSKIIVNKHRDPRYNYIQALLLQRTDVNDGNITAGCWYDQATNNVIGITDSNLRSQLTNVRNNSLSHNLEVYDSLDPAVPSKWYFIQNKNISFNCYDNDYYKYTSQNPETLNERLFKVSTNDFIRVLDFGQNSSGRSCIIRGYLTNGSTTYLYTGNTLEHAKVWNDFTGTYRDYILVPCSYENQSFAIDTETDESNIPISGNSSDLNYNNFCFIGKNKVVGFYSDYRNSWYYYGCAVKNFMPVSETSVPVSLKRHFFSTHWGWDGGNWVKDHPGQKTGHVTQEPLVKGIEIKFEDGPTSTTSFVQGDKYTFTCFDGYYKDNSSKMWMKDTVYYKPRTIETTFDPPIVQLYDQTTQKGLLAGSDPNEEWLLDQMPDTSYTGGQVLLTGDPDYYYVEYLNYFKETGDHGTKDEKYNEIPAEIGEGVELSNLVPITWPDTNQTDPTFLFNGNGGIIYNSQTKYSMESHNFTIEFWVYPISYGDEYERGTILDFRNSSTSEMGRFYIDENGLLVWFDGETYFGRTGTPVNLNEWNFVAFFRNGDLWTITLNGIVVASWTSNKAFPSLRPLKIGYSIPFGLHEVILIKNTNIPDPFGGNEVFTVQHTNSDDYHYFFGDFPVEAGKTYTFSVYMKEGNISESFIDIRSVNEDREICYLYIYIHGGGFYSSSCSPRKMTSVGNGWYRIETSFTPNNNDTYRFRLFPRYRTTYYSSYYTHYFGAMINEGNEALPYSPPGTGGNLLTDDFFRTAGKGLDGALSNLRITKRVARYQGNHPIPTKPFVNTGNIYEGARLKFSGQYLQGGIRSKKELVGNWEVIFRDITPWFKETVNNRPTLAFGITTTPYISNLTDIGFRFIASYGNSIRFQRWMEKWDNGSVLNSSTNAIRIKKENNRIFIYTSSNNGATWANLTNFEDFGPLYYIAFWLERPSGDPVNKPVLTPSVEIVSNGVDYISKVGNRQTASGVFHPRFLATDNYWESDFKIELDGVPTTKNRSNYQSEALPLEGEVYLHQHGVLRFHPNDAGKTITGKIMALHD